MHKMLAGSSLVGNTAPDKCKVAGAYAPLWANREPLLQSNFCGQIGENWVLIHSMAFCHSVHCAPNDFEHVH